MVRAGWQGWPTVSARRLSELDKRERRQAWLHTVAVLAVAWVVLVGVYYLVPTGVVPASRSVSRLVCDLPRAFRTADLWLIHAADCCSRYSSWTCCGVRY